MQEIVARAAGRAELLEIVVAPAYLRLLITGLPLDDLIAVANRPVRLYLDP